ncbi:hypothetical protein [Lacipirellula parvula]|uniref:Uncharacterized protein n=1 Tax=Lacipirellula parvula TaxID=2650471 RepID=A0A5K7XD88_9BACT|nr:hypothetical protein [Lacipirellula parvula]BBO32781.1 hypothetical protein PLANPX_2393 [Lacipirellula parvula]
MESTDAPLFLTLCKRRPSRALLAWVFWQPPQTHERIAGKVKLMVAAISWCDRWRFSYFHLPH